MIGFKNGKRTKDFSPSSFGAGGGVEADLRRDWGAFMWREHVYKALENHGPESE